MKKVAFPSAMFAEARFEPMTILPEGSDVLIEQIYIADEVIVALQAASSTASYPICGTVSERVQSRYTRTLADLPISTPDHVCALLFLPKEHLHPQDLCRTISFFNLPASEIQLAAAKGTPPLRPCIWRGGRSTPGKAVELTW